MSGSLLEDTFLECEKLFTDTQSLVRVVLSGRRRNMQTPYERIDLRPIALKGGIHIQVSHSDGRQMTTKNYAPAEAPFSELIRSGFANILIEHTSGSISVRITKRVNLWFVERIQRRNKISRTIVISHAYLILRIHFSSRSESLMHMAR